MTSHRALTAALCLTAAACSASAESARMDAFQATCLSVRGKSFAEAKQAFQVDPDLVPSCPPPSPLQPIANADDVCNYQQPVCQAWWSSRSSDSDLCSAIGCWFGCEIRFPQDASIVCVARFYTGQPCQYGLTGNCN
jgi:hypothetical protein